MPMRQQRYEEIAADLREKITAGIYPPGSKLPTRAQLRAIYDCADTVLDRAMILLRGDGVVETRMGVGTYVAQSRPG